MARSMFWKYRTWFYAPNIVGYIRLLCILMAVVSQNSFHQLLYMSANLILDIFDGKIARAFNQSTLFGARLDLILDMISLTLLSFYAAYLVQNLWLTCLFIVFGLNDLVGYLFSLFVFYGPVRNKNVGHKDVLKKKGIFLPLYYSAVGLGASNVLHDAYLLSYVYYPSWMTPSILAFLLLGFLFRQIAVAEQTVRIYSLIKSKALVSE